VRRKLGEALTFTTGDRDYAFMLQSRYRTPVTSLFDQEDFRIESQQKTSVVLFSGGLDSLAGAFEPLETTDHHVCLVSHRSQPGVMRTQDGLVRALKQQPRYAGRISHYLFLCPLTGIRAPEESQRTRAFLDTSIAFALCSALCQDEFFVYENDFNQKIHALLDGWRDDLVSEHPTVSFVGARVVVDHTLGRYGRDEFALGRAAASTPTVAHRSRGGFGGANPFALDRDVACES